MAEGARMRFSHESFVGPEHYPEKGTFVAKIRLNLN